MRIAPRQTERGIILGKRSGTEREGAIRPTIDSQAKAGPARAESAPEALVLPTWQAAVRDAVRDPAELARLLDLPPEALGALADAKFPLLVPRGFVARMRRGDPNDPLLKQILPAPAEIEPAAGFTADPVREQGLAVNGLIRKYGGRALLIASGTCPVHCRYCFRREFPYQTQLAARDGWEPAIAELRGHDDIREVILSGGDPLSLSNRRLGELLAKLADTAATTVRVHTRFPIVIPERIDADLVRLLDTQRLRTVVVVHTNHPNELDDSVAAALSMLRPHVAALLNQAVLLAGVNDDANTLAALSERLFDCGVLPYYLHALDPVAGAAHFDVAERRGVELIGELRARLPGYLVPRFVREVPGELSKTPLV
ncbi:MAG: EF-P beta-lysylation protein EpmB [Gammaproteobacteria bacterium]